MRRTYAGTRDGVAPVLIRVSLLDTDFDGMVDAARYEYSETVTHATSDCRVSCAFSLVGYALEVAGPGVGSSVTVGVTEQADGATVTTAGYSSLGEGVSDPAGNRAPSASMPTADATPPVAVSSETVDTDPGPGGNGRIDRIDLTFSEPISSVADSSAPYSFAASGYAVSGVSAASADRLSVSLTETTGPDTGSAPTISYTGQGGQGSRLTDSNGTEHAIRSYPGLTRDAVAPRFEEARTADVAPAEGDGRLDAVDLIYSEEIAGGASTAPFTIAGHPVSSVSYLSDRVRVRFDDTGASPDTDERPNVSYDDGLGDLRDVPEGQGDVADDAPPVAGQTPLDAAGPAVVAAVTGEEQEDLATPPTPDGKLDSLRVTFSEPIPNSPGVAAAIALGGGLLVDGGSATGDELALQVREGPAPVGDLKPTVTVTDPAQITDAATNPARSGVFSGTVDGVRPTLVDAEYGEESGTNSCEPDAVNGRVDCFRATWSEAVEQPNSYTVFSSSPRSPVSVMSTALDDDTDIRVNPGATADRDLPGSVGYAGGGGVADPEGNLGISSGGPIGATAACIDNAAEQNDVQDTGSPGSPSMNAQTYMMCAYDPDWFSVIAQGGEVNVRVDPSVDILLTAGLYHQDGTFIHSVTSPGPGVAADLVVQSGLVAGDVYWIQITADPASLVQEGPYCANPTGASCEDGDDVPQ